MLSSLRLSFSLSDLAISDTRGEERSQRRADHEMNRIPREDGGRNAPPPGLQQLRMARGLVKGGGALKDGDDGLDLFSKTRRSRPIGLEHESNEIASLGGISVVSAKLGMDDLLSSEIGKHDYDWLLTPPETPLFPYLEASDHQVPLASTRSSSNVRSVSVTRASRLSVSHTENGHYTRPMKSSSVTRPSIAAAHSASYFSNNNRTSVLNTSTASVTSRPSTPGNRTTTLPSSRTPAPTSRSVPSRPSAPVKARPSPSSNGNKAKPAHSSRPSTPTGRPPISHYSSSSISNALPVRTISRPSTPTRRTPAPASTPAQAPVTARSPSVGRASTTTSRIPSRPSSPAPRARPLVHPIIPNDFPLDAPPNLRTKLPERAVSAGRTRPGMALTVRANSNVETSAPMSSNRRNSSPVVTRGRFPENAPKPRVQSNGHDATLAGIQKNVASEEAVHKPVKPALATESTGFGRTISKKSLDVALKHMDIRQSVGGIRGASLFPQSIRSAASKGRPDHISHPTVATADNGDALHQNGNGTISQDCNGSVSENGDNTAKPPERESLVVRGSEPDFYGSYHYDTILLKEDSKNMDWLHSIEDMAGQSPEFDHRFEPLPEPFSIL